MWIFPNLLQNVNKIPNSKGHGLCTKYGCDGPGIQVQVSMHKLTCFQINVSDVKKCQTQGFGWQSFIRTDKILTVA